MKSGKKINPVEAVPDFPKMEKELLDHWYASGIVSDYLSRNRLSQKYFSFLDGPITANNPMGVHHGWGRTYKDLWQRFYNMLGYRQRFQNGFDCQGLWVEVEVEKELGFKNKKDIEKYGVAKFITQCKNRVKKFSAVQTEQSKRLGYFMDWDNSYFTMSDENNYTIWHFIQICHLNGWLYKGRESVPWCPRCETAISQHEMLTEDYKEITHKSIYLRLPLINARDEYLLIWTTTPWTIPANIAVAVDEKIKYSLILDESGVKNWVAQDSVKRIFSESKIKIISNTSGKKLVGLKYQAPFDELPEIKKVASENKDNFHTVVATDARILPISTQEGTGLVHTAVSAGTEDFKLGKKLGLPMVPVITDNADYLPGLGFLSGKNAKKHPEIILNFLKSEDQKNESRWIFKLENTTHRYPACWRCKTELVWKVTDEWYIAMDKGKPSLRQRMKQVAEKINWIPGFGLDRELDWLNHMHDWLISKKNRYWGLCLPIWECQSCLSFEVIGSKEELKVKAVEGWKQFAGKSPHKPYLDKVKVKCTKCGAKLSRIDPVGNPWLDAGIVPFSTIARNNQQKPLYRSDKTQWLNWYPVDFITESFPGQFKNWFYSLIAMSTVLENQPPMKTVLGFGTLLGEDGRPMHKSWGNSVNFHEGADKIGVDVMRWLYCRQDPSQNLLFGYQTANLVRRQFHLILWNCYRFVVNNLIIDSPYFNEKRTELSILDRWILSRLNSVNLQILKSLKNYDACNSTLAIEQLVQDFSTWYIRRSRERVGPAAESPQSKQDFYLTSCQVLITISKLLAPFTPFISDIIFTNLTGERSVHLTAWPDPEKHLIDKKLEARMATVREIVEMGHAARNKKQIKVRQPLAKLTVFGCQTTLPADYHKLIKDEINVKEVIIQKSKRKLSVSLDTTITAALKAEGQARELVRQIQLERKRLAMLPEEKIKVVVPYLPQGFEKQISQKTLAAVLEKGDRLIVEKAS